MIRLHTRLLLSYYQTRPDHSYLFILGARYLLCLALVQRQSYKIVQAFCKNRNLTHYLNFWNAIRFLFYFFFFSNKKKWSCGTRFFVPSMKEVISSISNNFHYNYLPAQEVTPSWKRNKLFSLSGTGINNAVQLYQPPYLASQLIFFSEKNFRTARWMAMHIHQPQASNKRVAK